MRRLLLLVLIASIAALGGCTPARPKAPAGSDSSAPPFVGSPLDPEKESETPLVKRPLGTFDGTVFDPATRRPVTNVTIQVVPIEEEGKAKAKFAVLSDSRGCFNVPGLEKGRRYALIARTKRGEQVWSGRATAVASDSRVAIWLTETRPVAGASPAKLEEMPLPPIVPPLPEVPPADRMAHEKELVPRPPAVSVPGVGDDPRRKLESPLPAPPMRDEDSPLPKPETKSAEMPEEAEPTKSVVPSCVRTGETIYGFALKDYDGNDWQLRKVCKGKVVLVDFWKPGCAPCIASIPKLAALQRRWGDKGLQVVGVMCEAKGSLLARQQAVRSAWHQAGEKKFNYPVLFSETFDCPVMRDFGVGRYPTFVLLDEKGKILGRWEGYQEREIEAKLARKLGR